MLKTHSCGTIGATSFLQVAVVDLLPTTPPGHRIAEEDLLSDAVLLP
jgi:hypothetical protein